MNSLPSYMAPRGAAEGITVDNTQIVAGRLAIAAPTKWETSGCSAATGKPP